MCIRDRNYYVTKYNTTTNCESYPRSLVVATINAVPLGVSTPSTQTVCSDAAITTIVLSTSNSMTGTTYAWTRDNTVSVTGLAAAGSGDISGTPINVIGTDQTVTYTITPTSAAGCVGNPFTATVTVRSKPVGVSTPSPQTVCSDAAITAIVLSTSNSMTGTTYAWTRDNTVSVTGLAAAGSGDISGTPINVSGTDQTVTYTITPTSAAGCVGDPFTATVTVRSKPVGVSTPATQTICSDAAITTIVLSTSNSMAGTTYAWTRNNTVSVTGMAASGTGDISGTLRNLTGSDQTVTFTIIPTSGNGCAGDAITATVLVHPEPIAVATPASQTICSKGAIIPIVLTTSNGMNGVTTYAWTRDNTTNVTGLENGTGDISGSLKNVSGTDQTVTFTIIPTSGNGCAGDAITATVVVHPEPIAVATPASQTICSKGAIIPIVLTTSNGMNLVTTYAWTRDNDVNVTGMASSGTGDISGTLRNLTGSDQTVTFTIIPTSGNGCAGDAITATVLVHPEPIAVATPPSQTICSKGAIIPIVLTTSNGMNGVTTYAWTRDNDVNVTGMAASGTGDISGTLRNL